MVDIKDKADAQWGKFRKYIAANPLTGFWSGVALGFAVAWFL